MLKNKEKITIMQILNRTTLIFFRSFIKRLWHCLNSLIISGTFIFKFCILFVKVSTVIAVHLCHMQDRIFIISSAINYAHKFNKQLFGEKVDDK